MFSSIKDEPGLCNVLVDKEFGKELMSTQSLAIVEEDGSLGSGDDQTAVSELNDDPLLAGTEDIPVHFRSDGVTYRVVQVNPANNTVDAVPLVPTSSGYVSPQHNTIQAAVLANPINGQVYVIGDTNEVFSSTNQRSLAPRFNSNSNDSLGSTSRDDKRRASHNEVERRRRDKINNWIMKLSKIIPESPNDSHKSFEGLSKGGILAKACDYIHELRSQNIQYQECLNENKKLALEVENLKRENEELKLVNNQLKDQLIANGLLTEVEDSLT
ncbi:unnamed protein product [Bemisia tabaci]|uniref:BHLH domain-containing protein n=1 Tax=Bemisia tabaci TaxID=7038 RepID=A0A9P0A8K0_BEMTA|nr:unnamed protein product [Bemisia tabaci]